MSEPKAGAHPKYLKTTARESKDGFILNGRKAFLTNGPHCRVFSGGGHYRPGSGEKYVFAFLVNKDAPGLTVGDPMEIPFFKPCPHGEIVLDQCRVSHDALVGSKDQAWPSMVLPFRAFGRCGHDRGCGRRHDIDA